jgi:hypothetical protein
MSIETRKKISDKAKLQPSNLSRKGKILVPRLQKICLNCAKQFETPRWQNHIYCSVACAMHVTGSRPTSPKAARGKYGIRKDIDPSICFFSRWEANVARIYTFLELDWIFQPATFQLETQKYTPDFYLPDLDQYVEVKNFLSDYSKNRDLQFRKLYPGKQLILILKDDYLQLQELFTPYIPKWEYANSK